MVVAREIQLAEWKAYLMVQRRVELWGTSLVVLMAEYLEVMMVFWKVDMLVTSAFRKAALMASSMVSLTAASKVVRPVALKGSSVAEWKVE